MQAGGMLALPYQWLVAFQKNTRSATTALVAHPNIKHSKPLIDTLSGLSILSWWAMPTLHFYVSI